MTLKLALPWFFKVVLQLQEAPVYRIYLFSRGWFYLKLMEGSLDYIEVKRGEHVSVHLALQVLRETFRFSELSFSKILRTNFPLFQQIQKIPIDDFFRSTVPEGTHDCEANTTFNYDEVKFCLSLKMNFILSGDHQGLL